MPTPLSPGDRAPDFSGPTGDGSIVSLSDHAGERALVLYFYPRDNTPGCTREARAFRDTAETIRASGAEIIGVSTNSEASHQRFASNLELNFPLVADTNGAIAKAYGVLKANGKTAERATFLINREGIIRNVWPRVTINGHAEEVASAADQLRRG